MNRLKQAALLTYLIDRLRDKGSWCGETHIQKAAYFAQTLGKVRFDFDFILYKHGPFSFELRDELTSLRADGFLALEPQPYPYGPKYKATALCQALRTVYRKALSAHQGPLDFYAERLAGKRIDELERLATALYVTIESEGGKPADERARQLCAEKPHIQSQQARQAIVEIDSLIAAREPPRV